MQTISRYDLVKEMMKACFILGDTESELAIETRKQLTSIRDKGILDFDSSEKEEN